MAESYWVVNASPIIALAKVDRLDLLLSSARTLVLPEAVAEEILAGPAGDPARTAVSGGFGGIPTPVEIPSEVSALGLCRGESADSYGFPDLQQADCLFIVSDYGGGNTSRHCGRPFHF